METMYYGYASANKKLCGNCGVEEGEVNGEIRTLYKTVLPQCNGCKTEGKKLVTYGALKNAQAVKRRAELGLGSKKKRK